MPGFLNRLRHRYFDILSHNRKVRNFLTDISNKINDIDDIGNVSDIIKEIKVFSQKTSLKFTYSHIWVTAIPLILIGCLMLRIQRPFAIYWLMGSVAVSAILFICSYLQNHAFLISKISEKLFSYCLFSQNSLKLEKEISFSDGREMYENLRIRFHDFERGDEDQHISKLIEGECALQDIRFTYQYYEFHYVEVEKHYTTDDDGKTTESESRSTRYRYGLLLSFPYAKNIILGSENRYKEKWTTASPEFNRYWKVSASDKMHIAKFLKPTMVLSLIELSKAFSDVIIEISYESVMCISLSEDLLKHKRKHSIQKINKFEKELLGDLRLKRLEQMLTHIASMFKYTQR